MNRSSSDLPKITHRNQLGVLCNRAIWGAATRADGGEQRYVAEPQGFTALAGTSQDLPPAAVRASPAASLDSGRVNGSDPAANHVCSVSGTCAECSTPVEPIRSHHITAT